MINENLTTWLGSSVEDYDLGESLKQGVTYRLRTDWESKVSMPELFASFTADPSADAVKAIVIGAWFGDASDLDSSELVQLLVGARHSLPRLEAIFFGDIISEENEMSWITQSDLSPLFSAYSGLKHFVVRGSADLSLGGNLKLESLETLSVQSGGLPTSVLREIFSLDLPHLVSLDLWLGTEEYGWDGSIADLAPLFEGGLFPGVRHLGLRNSEITDQITEGIITAPILDRLESLDLSLGTLTDVGAASLVKCPKLKQLKNVDLHHHYCTMEGMTALRKHLPNINLDDVQELDSYGPFVAVGE